MFSAMIVAMLLMLVGDVIWDVLFNTPSVAHPSVAQSRAYPISFAEAGVIAQDTAPRAAIIGDPTLTSYEGAVAYAVPMDAGMIYVEATTGRVLANLAAVAATGVQQE
jgi:hypothetical protein